LTAATRVPTIRGAAEQTITQTITPTIKEVAREAGVSVATVSHVLNATRYVSPELTERVRTAAAGLGYTPNRTARSLRIRRTQTIGLIVPDVYPFFAQLARAIENEGFAAGYTTVLGNSDGHPERERTYLETLISQQVDGLILASTLHDAASLGEIIRSSGTPVVVLDRELDVPGVDAVLADNVGGGYAAASHLVGLGHRRIACLTGGHDGRLPAAGRLGGYRRALEEARIEYDRGWVASGGFDYPGGRRALAEVLELDPELTAVFAMNDQMAFGALAELAARGIHVPADFSVCGFDDVFPAELVAPPLTTVRQPLEELGRAAVVLLRARMEGNAPDEPVRRLFPTTLVVRESTARCRGSFISSGPKEEVA
jgi:LacI family transcriptional regulator